MRLSSRLPGKRLAALLIASGTTLLVLGAATAVLHDQQPRTPGQPVPLDLSGRPVQVDLRPDDENLVAAQVVNDLGHRLQIPSVALDVPLGSLVSVQGEVDPPGYRQAYLVGNKGVPLTRAETGTVYVVMHSLSGEGTGPGDALIDLETGTAAVQKGDRIQVANQSYAITRTEQRPKLSVPNSSDIWRNTPGRLVVITCMQTAQGTETDTNLVIEATLLP